MINKIYLKFLGIIINIIDASNKRKILNFFKKHFINKEIIIIDIGAHKGETIELFKKNFNLKKIFAFEPNNKLFLDLINKKKFQNKYVEINNLGVGEKSEIKELNIMSETSSSTFNDLDLSSKYYNKKNFIVNMFSSKKGMVELRQKVKIINLSDFIKEKSITKIDLLKIDTEGYEYNIVKGIYSTNLGDIDFIYFEHHYDLMIKKHYKFSDLNDYLNKNNFFQIFKIKMNFRKTFEYIYKNSKTAIN